MIRIDTIVRGEPKALRVTFMDADSEEALDATGWTLYAAIGRSRGALGDILEASATADAVSGAQGQVTVTLTAEQTALLLMPSVVVELSVDTGGGTRVPLMLAVASVQSPDEYRQQYYQTNISNSQLLKDVPTVVQGSTSQPQEITMSFSTNLDPTFDLGVLVKFDELSATTKAYLDALQTDVAAKYNEIIGA